MKCRYRQQPRSVSVSVQVQLVLVAATFVSLYSASHSFITLFFFKLLIFIYTKHIN